MKPSWLGQHALAVLGLSALGLVAACTQPTQLLVLVHSNETNLEKLALSVSASAEGIQANETVEFGDASFPVSFGIEPPKASLDAPVELRLVLARDGMQLASTRRSVRGFLANKKAYVQFCLRTDCDDEACPQGMVCGNEGCVSPDRNPSPDLDKTFACGAGRPPSDGGISDATVDSGPADTGAQDTGEPQDADVGLPDASIADGSPSDTATPDSGATPWWRVASTHRHRLRLTAPTGVTLPVNTVVRVEFNNALYRTMGITDTTGQTVKLMHNGVEISRRGDATAGFGASGNTLIYFRLQDTLLPDQSTEDYEIYFGGSGATAPPNPEPVPSFRVRTIDSAGGTTTSTEALFVATMPLPPARLADRWVVMGLWRIRNVATLPTELADASMSLWEGTQSLVGSEALTSPQLPNGTMLGGTMMMQNGRPGGGPMVHLKLHSPSRNPTEVTWGRLTAFLVPEGGFQSAVNDAQTIDAQATALSVLNVPTGDNLWIARAGYRADTVSGTSLRLESIINQNTNTVRNLPTSMPTSSGLFQSLLNFSFVSGANSLQIVHWPPVGGAERRGVGQIVIPTTQFESVERTGFGGRQPFSPGGSVLATLQPRSAPAGRPLTDWVYLANTKITGVSGTLDFRLNSTTDVSAGVLLPDSSGSVVVPWAFSETAATPSTLSARGTSTANLASDNGTFIALRYKDPLVFTAAIEMRP